MTLLAKLLSIFLSSFIEALHGTAAKLGEGTLLDDATDEIARELYAIALASPEDEVFV